jgi:hypothetical protein
MFGLLVVLRNEPFWRWPTADGDCNVPPDFDALTGDGEIVGDPLTRPPTMECPRDRAGSDHADPGAGGDLTLSADEAAKLPVRKDVAMALLQCIAPLLARPGSADRRLGGSAY